jgi:hypothetical protein
MELYHRLSIVSLVLIHVALNVVLPGVVRESHDSDLFMFLWIGACMAQVTLIAAWSVFAPLHVTRRIAWGISFATLMWSSLVLGCRLGFVWSPEPSLTRAQALFLAVAVAWGCCTAVIPLVALRALARYRWRMPLHHVCSLQPARQFSVREMMIVATLACLLLGLTRLLLPPGEWKGLDIPRDLHTALHVLTLTQWVLAAPCLWLAYRKLPTVIVTSMLWPCVVAWAWAFVQQGLLRGQMRHLEWSQQLFVLYALNVGHCLGMFVVVALLRSLGYRFVRVAARRVIDNGPPASENAGDFTLLPVPYAET